MPWWGRVACQEISFCLWHSCGAQKCQPLWPPRPGDQGVSLCVDCVWLLVLAGQLKSVEDGTSSVASEKQWEKVSTVHVYMLHEFSRKVPCVWMHRRVLPPLPFTNTVQGVGNYINALSICLQQVSRIVLWTLTFACFSKVGGGGSCVKTHLF